MENSHDDDHSCCGCNGIFCCIFRGSCDSNKTRDHEPSFSDPATLEKKSRPVLESQAYPHYPDFEPHVQKQGYRSGSDLNKAVSDYIDHGKVKIRAMSNVGHDDIEIVYSKTDQVCNDSSEKKADANDMFTDYINRAKMKIRRTSSLGSKKIISFRK